MKRLNIPTLVVGTGLSFSLNTAPAIAGWVPGGMPVTITSPGQQNPTIISDGSGGAIIAWSEYAEFPNYHIYVQRLDDTGNRLWTASGVRVCADNSYQNYPQLVSDGAGGAIIAWGDYRGPDSNIYAQRVDAAGTPLWTASGVAICTAPNDQDFYHTSQLLCDGAGGAIITWEDARDSGWDIYLQRVDGAGVPIGIANGTPICTATGVQQHPGLASDGAGGVIVVWYDGRKGTSGRDVCAQRVDASVAPLWTADGVIVSAWSSASTRHAQIVGDGAGGAIIAWDDNRGGNSHVYARRINAIGIPLWTVDGVPLTAVGDQHDPRIASDEAGGAIITWGDRRNGNLDIYAQRLDPDGSTLWTAGGAALCTDASTQANHQLVSDGVGGAIIAWEDGRNGARDIYGRRIDATGAPMWTPDGVVVSMAADDQYQPQIASDGADGAIVTWVDMRNNGYTPDVYAQHLGESPNAVAISSFAATAGNGIVTLRATFHSDLGVVAVDVYRGSGADAYPRTVIQHVENARSDRFEYVDRDVAPGQTYRYQIGVIDADGTFLSPIAEVSVASIVGALAQNRPNPFNPTTTIEYTLSERSPAVLAIYDATGALVARLDQGVQDAGTHAVEWDGRNARGAVVSGVYFYRMEGVRSAGSKKMVLLK